MSTWKCYYIVDMTRFDSTEDSREYLRSEASRHGRSADDAMHSIHEALRSLQSESSEISLQAVVAPWVDEWRINNPEAAQEMEAVIGGILTGLGNIAREIEHVTQPVTTAVTEWIQDNPESIETLGLAIETFAADGLAAQWQKRYEEEGLPIPFDRAVRLAFCLMAFRIPYTEDRNDQEADVTQIHDYEILTVDALRDERYGVLIEDSRSSDVSFRALQQVVRSLRRDLKPLPSEVKEWALDVADGTREDPNRGRGRKSSANRVRDDLVARTVQNLVSCGLTATRNEATAPKSACDVVSKALSAHGTKLSYHGVAKVWRASR